MPRFNPNVPNIARVYDYWLGGKDNFAADRVLGDQMCSLYPKVVFGVRANRAFLARTVRFLVAEAGIRQFLDIGTGIPTASNTHQVAQELEPRCRIVYVDNDPMVLSHAQALLKSTPQGACAYLDADLNDPDAIVAAAAETLDFSKPVAVMLIAVLHMIGDETVRSIVDRLMSACSPGSFLAISHPASDVDDGEPAAAGKHFNSVAEQKMTMRDRSAVIRLFDGLELVEPGVTRVAKWRPDSEIEAAAPGSPWGGVASKP